MPSKDEETNKAKPVEASKPKTKSVSEIKPAETKAKTEAPKPEVNTAAPVAEESVPAEGTKGGKFRSWNIADMRGTIIKVAAIAVALIAVVVIIFGVLIYAYKSENPVVKAVASVVPYPVERVNGHFISYKEYMFQVDSEKLAQQSNAKINNQPRISFTRLVALVLAATSAAGSADTFSDKFFSSSCFLSTFLRSFQFQP